MSYLTSTVIYRRCKYLGIEESECIQHQQMKEGLLKVYMRISKLNAKNKITAFEALAVAILRYSFGSINWRLEEIKKIDRKTRTVLKVYKMHHPKADIGRLYVKMKGGGRGLLQIEATYKAEIISIAEYLSIKYAEDQFLNIVKSEYSNQPNMNSTIKAAAKVAEACNQ